MPPFTRKRKRDCESAALNDMMMENMGYFKYLPTEIIEIILCHLDAPALSNLSCTCRKLRELSNQIWKEICKGLSLDYIPTPLCIASPSATSLIFDYDDALRKCTQGKWRVIAVRSWLYCKWKCIVCYRACSKRTDPHRDILLCESCHPVFYRRKSSAKEQFGLTERDLSLISGNGFEYLVTDLIFLARTKYGGRDGLEQRLRERRDHKMKREAERECTLIGREAKVIEALHRHGSSFVEVGIVDSRFMPYVSIPTTYRRCSSQTADDAAKWLMSMKERYETRYKVLLDQILLQSSQCKGCKNAFSQRVGPVLTCNHISETTAQKTFNFIRENFIHDIQTYTKSGLLSEAQNGPTDCESWAALELYERAERKANLRKALDHESEWPAIVQNGTKDPLQCSIANDFIYKGVVLLQYQTGRCRLKQARDVARVILAAARGWDNRNKELNLALLSKGCYPPFDDLGPESLSLMDDYVDHMVIVRNNTMIACSAMEVANKIAALQGMAAEPDSPTTKRCLRIYSECLPKEDAAQLAQQREKLLKSRFIRVPSTSNDDLKRRLEMTPAKEFIKLGNTRSLFGYKLTTADSVAEVILLRESLSLDKQESNPDFMSEQSNPCRINIAGN
eukprot:gene6070-6772_t